MEIRFTRHAQQKFEILRRHGVAISRARVIAVLKNSDFVDSVTRFPLHIAQGSLDIRRVLRVVYKVEADTIVVITFYPGRKSQYEN